MRGSKKKLVEIYSYLEKSCRQNFLMAHLSSAEKKIAIYNHYLTIPLVDKISRAKIFEFSTLSVPGFQIQV